jgi:hypothetical protein
LSTSVVIVTWVPSLADDPVIVTETPVDEPWLEEAPPPEVEVVVEPWAVVLGCSTTRAAAPLLPEWSASPANAAVIV